jgi:hypothetical protein
MHFGWSHAGKRSLDWVRAWGIIFGVRVIWERWENTLTQRRKYCLVWLAQWCGKSRLCIRWERKKEKCLFVYISCNLKAKWPKSKDDVYSHSSALPTNLYNLFSLRCIIVLSSHLRDGLRWNFPIQFCTHFLLSPCELLASGLNNHSAL